MNYEEALDYIHGTYKYGSKLGIHNISCLLNHMGNPQKKLKFVHVAGTNGKGSTVAFISQILIEAGYKVGVFTSPHVQRFTERIKINECEIDGCDLGRVTSFVKEKVNLMLADGECHPTEFEVVTAIAMQYFMESSCDVVVLEVGLGGRLDSTNVIDVPDLAIITTISLDHTDILGETLQEVAFEKAGIIKEGGEVLCYPQPGEVEELFEKVCNQKGAHLRIADFSKIRKISNDILGQVFDFNRYKELEITLLGEYQQKNAALAVMAAEILSKKGYKISVPHIYSGLKNAG
jgi:dihydrofolate synthase/folylpolyglutamate synthase